MKRIVSVLFICFICVALTIPCFAAEFANPPVADDAGYLTESQLEEISEKLEGIRQKYSFEVAIVTESEMSDSDIMLSAIELYERKNYGIGENCDGVLFYICSGTREYSIVTRAKGETVFNENGVEYIKKNIKPHLEDGNYYLAMDTYANLADKLLAMAESGEPFNEKQYDSTYVLIVIGCGLFIPFIIAWVMMSKKLAKMKTAVENDYAANYIKEGSKRLYVTRDIFLYSHVTKTEKPKDDSSGSHKSSSGKTYGGSSGSF